MQTFLALCHQNQVIPYSNSIGKPVHSSLVIIFITRTNSRGLNTDPWCNPTFTLNALLSPYVVLTTVCAPSYIAMTAFTIIPPLLLSLESPSSDFSRYSIKCFFQVYKSKVELLVYHQHHSTLKLTLFGHIYHMLDNWLLKSVLFSSPTYY